jgi:hypothetical protein
VTPDHAVVTMYMCGEKTLCAKLIQVPDLAARDGKNPDRSLRNRPLCGLELSKDFEIIDSSHARGGRIYDPDPRWWRCRKDSSLWNTPREYLLPDVSKCKEPGLHDKLVCKIASTVSVPKGIEIRRQLPLILNVDSRSERCYERYGIV